MTWKARDMEGTFGRVFRLLSFVQVYQENHATGTCKTKHAEAGYARRLFLRPADRSVVMRSPCSAPDPRDFSAAGILWSREYWILCCRWGGVRRASGREMGSGAARVGGADPGARGGRTRGTLKRRTGCPGSAPRCAARPIPPHPRRPPIDARF